MNGIRNCEDHGYFSAEHCPTCDRAGEPVLAGDDRRQLSKFLSGLLRHFPAEYNLTVDGRGWTAEADVVARVTDRYDWADRDAVDAVVATDPKGRFEVDEVGFAPLRPFDRRHPRSRREPRPGRPLPRNGTARRR